MWKNQESVGRKWEEGKSMMKMKNEERFPYATQEKDQKRESHKN